MRRGRAPGDTRRHQATCRSIVQPSWPIVVLLEMQMGELRYYVYGLFLPSLDDELGVPIYVGKGQGSRHREHHRASSIIEDKPLYREIRRLASLGITPEPVILEDWLTEQAAYDWEEYLIAYFGRQDLGIGPLLNQTDGGNGGLSVGYRHSEERKQKIREASKARWRVPLMRDRITRNMLTADRKPNVVRKPAARKGFTKPGSGICRRIRLGRLSYLVTLGGTYIGSVDLYCHALRLRKAAEKLWPNTDRAAIVQAAAVPPCTRYSKAQ